MSKVEMQKKAQDILTQLFAAKPETVLEALQKIFTNGRSEMISPLLKTYKAWETHEQIRDTIASILKQMKQDSAIPELITALDDPEFDNERALIISVFWNAGLWPVDDLDVLIKHAIRGDYFVTLETLTVIENLENEVPTEALQDAIFDVDDFLDSYPEAPHALLLVELKNVLSNLYNL